MNVRRSVERLPEAIKRLIASDPAVKARLEPGMELADALSDPEWAEAWLHRCRDADQLAVLRGVLNKYGANPFEPERIAADAEEELGLTGAEARVAIAKLRRSGIVFAVRKSWGDRLIYVPDDAVALWQPLLLPADNRPLEPEEAWEVAPNAADFRQPLALGLLSAWHEIARKPVARTAKGAPQQAAVARVAAAMRLEAEALKGLLPAYPYAEQVPPQAVLALDLGLVCGVLDEQDGIIGVRRSGLNEWLGLTLREADRRLHGLVMTRYCSSRPAFHLTFSAALGLSAGKWHTEGRIGGQWQSREEADGRLALLEALGWIERGTWQGQTVIRRRMEPMSYDEGEESPFILQPDGEILVPPDVGLATRWTLFDVAEMEKADELCVYRLTRRSCEEAFRLGYSLGEVLGVLERGGRAPVPEPVRAALRDWFASLGRTELVEALVLRADSKEVADVVASDADIAGMILERIGDRHFLVDAAAGKTIRAKLRQVGYPPADAVRMKRGGTDESRSGGERPERVRLASDERPAGGDQKTRERSAGGELAGKDARSSSEERGWLGIGSALSAFESDRGITGTEELFPGLGDIPAAWVTRPRKYHPSTSKELIRRAIEWRTAVRLEREGDACYFAPRTMHENGASWVAEGRWRHSSDGRDSIVGPMEPARVRAEEVAELMIVLPDLEELETI
ncbi:helicase-associated domain-containing protein [Cohnella sp.]|uniref:helicase-associated domain-containing protein n=1 Tax=Cohnella sp. TaxID=1883426 RepID=UPI003566BAF4